MQPTFIQEEFTAITSKFNVRFKSFKVSLESFGLPTHPPQGNKLNPNRIINPLETHMAVSMSDVLQTARSLTSNMRHRDTVMESNRRLARSALCRLESNLEADASVEKMSTGERSLTLSDPLPPLIKDSPQYRLLYEDNQKLYVVVAEQQLTLEMIMEKYRAKMAESTDAVKSFVAAQKCLERKDGILGALMHEKGVLLQAMNKAVWEDDGDDVALSEHAAELAADNATLREVVRASLQLNGRTFLSTLSAERGNQTSPLGDVVEPNPTNS
ncbi:hypothetical protein BV898_00895 [Hypsibius exemplaris]|uniref:Uncharacterized protein n=1 Tax=Hypsibius exemplaris TaxID=2072580 RepID=A0A1W0XCI4_HYPEX|nr:hypothetical protein BV898_00895 [Hypsibius exemplaris]